MVAKCEEELARRRPRHLVIAVALAAILSAVTCLGPSATAPPAIVGEWKSSIRFDSGALASMQGLEFMLVFNLGGTMTESSNYDGAPPVPPAYGIWKSVGPREFEAKYEFYVTRPPATIEELTKGSGWLPSGRGVFHERITLSADGRSFTSTIRYEAFGVDGKPVEGGGEGKGAGSKLEF